VSNWPLLSLLIWVPILGAVSLLVLGGEKRPAMAKSIAMFTSIVCLLLCIPLWQHFDIASTGFQYVESADWFPALSIQYSLGIDGFALPLIVLTCFFTPIVILSAWRVIKKQTAQYMAAFLIIQGLMCGVFAALDAILFYIFWEGMLIPMFLIIGIWGGQNRVYATIKFFLYTFLGSVFLLIALIYLHFAAVDQGVQESFSILSFHGLSLSLEAQKWIFFAFLIAFAVKVPMWPVHTWLPDAHVEAPTPISVILAGILLKMGTYGMIRFNFQMLPEATRWAAEGIAIFGMINIVYAALVCLAQKDLKKLIAYSSVSHMGFVLLGLAAFTHEGISGAVFQMFSHGLVSLMLFLIAGVIYDRAHTRDIEGFGGLAQKLPEYTAMMGLAFMASLGLPGLAGFVGEFLVFIGAFNQYRVYTLISATAVIITAAYYLWTIQRMFLGKFNEKWSGLWDLNWRERIMLYPLGVLIIIFGFYPMPVFDLMNKSLFVVVDFLKRVA